MPASVDLEIFTCYLYENAINTAQSSILTKVLGAAATFNLTLPVRQNGRLAWDIRGVLPADVARQGAPVYDPDRPQTLKNASAYFGGQAIKFNQYTLALGNEVDQADDHGARH